MKTLHLSGAMFWGGNEQQLADLIHYFSAFDVENTIFCFKNSPIEKYALQNDLEVVSVKKTKSHVPSLLRQLAVCVREKNIQIIHIHTSNFVTTYVLADILYKMNIPTVFSKKGISDKSTWLSPLKYNYKGINRIICVSGRVKEAFKKMLKKKNHHKLTVIYDGIRLNRGFPAEKPDLRRTLDLTENTFLIGNIANHSRSKDLGVLLKTARYLIYELKRTNVFFVQMGRSSKFTREFIGLLEGYKLRPYIKFMGFVADAHAYINQFNAFIMTSKTEGIPLAVYEAFFYKTPVVSTVAGGIAEVIIHGENGLLADISDYKSLAYHLNDLMSNPSLSTQFTNNAYQKLTAEYDAAHAAKHTCNLYETMIHEKH